MKAIITVDDDALITQVLKFQLTKHFDSSDIIIESVNEPEATIALIDDIRSCGVETVLIIVDYQMPKLNGAQLIRQIISKYPEIKYIMLSGQANDIIVNELKEEGLINAFLHKPWDEKEMIRIVEQQIK